MRTHDWNGHVPAEPRSHRGWKHVPVWLRWLLAVNGAVFFGALIWGLVS